MTKLRTEVYMETYKSSTKIEYSGQPHMWLSAVGQVSGATKQIKGTMCGETLA